MNINCNQRDEKRTSNATDVGTQKAEIAFDLTMDGKSDMKTSVETVKAP